jgi:hypothetical protein
MSDAVLAQLAKFPFGILWLEIIFSSESDLFWISEIASLISTVNY